jgi:hypothetical protein
MNMMNGWQRFADFLHKANLIPLVVVVSTYHYYQALRTHDPFWVALPIALFVDLLHFRTVQQAVRTGEGTWKVTAVFTTLMAFGLQWIFYSRPAEGDPLIWWQVLLFASIVPVGLAIMAWHHQRQEQETIIDWQALIAEAQQQAGKRNEKQRPGKREPFGRSKKQKPRAGEQRRCRGVQKQRRHEPTRCKAGWPKRSKKQRPRANEQSRYSGKQK